jgi:VCBS repeat-containing protein
LSLVISTNTGSTLSEGGLDTVLSSELSITDGVAPPELVIYSLDSITANGTLFNDLDGDNLIDAGEELTIGGTFTQADIEAGHLRYLHSGSETTLDGFDFSVTDGLTTLSGNSFEFAIAAVNDAPTVSGPATLSVTEDMA